MEIGSRRQKNSQQQQVQPFFSRFFLASRDPHAQVLYFVCTANNREKRGWAEGFLTSEGTLSWFFFRIFQYEFHLIFSSNGEEGDGFYNSVLSVRTELCSQNNFCSQQQANRNSVLLRFFFFFESLNSKFKAWNTTPSENQPEKISDPKQFWRARISVHACSRKQKFCSLKFFSIRFFFFLCVFWIHNSNDKKPLDQKMVLSKSLGPNQLRTQTQTPLSLDQTLIKNLDPNQIRTRTESFPIPWITD